MSANAYPNVQYWLFLGTKAQLAYASTLDGYVAERLLPKARLKFYAGFATKKQAIVAEVLINKRFPALARMINPEPLMLPPNQMAALTALGFNERKRKAFLWNHVPGIYMKARPWEVYVQIIDNGERFDDAYTPRIKPGTYGPLPMPRKPLYELGEITGWLHLQGYKVHSRWGVQTVFVSRNAAKLLRLRFYRGT